MSENKQSEFCEAFEFYFDKVSMDDRRLRDAAKAVEDDQTVIKNQAIGAKLAELNRQDAPYVELTFDAAARLTLKHLK